MLRDLRERRPLEPIADHDLTAHVLGRLDPADRERVERALAADPALHARRAAIAAHLARYDALAAPPPPPFATLATRLAGVHQARRPRTLRLVGAVAAAAVVVAALAVVLLAPGDDRPTASSARRGAGLGVTAAGAWIAHDEPAEGWIGERVHVVLDRDARLVPESDERIRLLSGRAWFDVRPGAGRCVVATPLGDVRVLGTAFEVVAEAPSLFVAVGRGRVEAGGHVLARGEALVDGRVVTAPHEPGAFYRHPVLRLTPEADPVVGEALALRFTFANPGRVPIELAGPDGVRAALWLEIVDPSGEVHDVAVPGADAAGGPLAPGRPLRLAGRGETSFTARLGPPLGDRGTYRCRALYRPEGQPSLVSDALLLEVR